MTKLLARLLGALALTLSLPLLAAPSVSMTAPTNGNLYLAPATFAVMTRVTEDSLLRA